MKLNKDIDSVNFDDILVDLKLTPDVLELPIPRRGGFTAVASSWLVALESAARFGDSTLEPEICVSLVQTFAFQMGKNTCAATPRYFTEDRKAELEGRAKFLEALVEKYDVGMQWEEELVQQPALPEEEAIKVMQVNERGRQGRERARLVGLNSLA